MRNRIILALSLLGVLAGLASAFVFGIVRKPQPPVFAPVSNPYPSAIYANGIVESAQAGGSNVSIYPEVAGTVAEVLVREGERVAAGAPLLVLDDSVQKASTEQLRLQSEAALALLDELRAEPRKETLAIAKAQVTLAESNLKVARDQYAKRRSSYDIDPRSISKDALDTANDAVAQAQAALDLARTQFDSIRAGAWSYDIRNQQRQYEALRQSYEAAAALLRKYTLRARIDGVVLALNTSPGSYVSPQGGYDPMTGATVPVAIMTAPQDFLEVRCYVDEILVSRLPPPERMVARMSLRGSEVKVPLEFVRVQPYVSPKIELSDQRQEKVDLRVLPVIFRFRPDPAMAVYAGQLVDVFIGSK